MANKKQISEVMKALSKKAAKARKNIPAAKRKLIAQRAASVRWSK